MPPSLNDSGVLRDAIDEHPAIIRQLTTQQAASRYAAMLPCAWANIAVSLGEHFETTGGAV
jgi:hypothetical protein